MPDFPAQEVAIRNAAPLLRQLIIFPHFGLTQPPPHDEEALCGLGFDAPEVRRSEPWNFPE
jgi:hypothetical protein